MQFLISIPATIVSKPRQGIKVPNVIHNVIGVQFFFYESGIQQVLCSTALLSSQPTGESQPFACLMNFQALGVFKAQCSLMCWSASALSPARNHTFQLNHRHI